MCVCVCLCVYSMFVCLCVYSVCVFYLCVFVCVFYLCVFVCVFCVCVCVCVCVFVCILCAVCGTEAKAKAPVMTPSAQKMFSRNKKTMARELYSLFNHSVFDNQVSVCLWG